MEDHISTEKKRKRKHSAVGQDDERLTIHKISRHNHMPISSPNFTSENILERGNVHSSEVSKKIHTASLKFQPVITSSNSNILPYIVHFSPTPPPVSSLDTHSDSMIKFEAFHNSDQRKAHQHVLLAHTEKMLYKGQNFGEEALNTNLNKYAIGIFDKNSGICHVVETQGLFTMKGTVKHMKERKYEGLSKDMEFSAKREILVQTFGNKQAKRRSKAMSETSLINGEIADEMGSVIRDAISLKALEVDEERTPLLENIQQESSSSFSDCPPFEKDAQSPGMVYNFNHIFSPEAISSLPIDELIPLLDKPKKIQFFLLKQNLPVFLMNIWNGSYFREIKSREKQLEIASITLCLGYLIVFSRRKRITKTQQALVHELNMPVPLLVEFCRLFTQVQLQESRKSFVITDELRTKLVNYMLVLALLANGGSIALDPIAKELHLKRNRAVLHFRRVGCVILKENNDIGRRDEAIKKDNTETVSIRVAKLKGPPTERSRNIANKLPRSLWQ